MISNGSVLTMCVDTIFASFKHRRWERFHYHFIHEFYFIKSQVNVPASLALRCLFVSPTWFVDNESKTLTQASKPQKKSFPLFITI